MSPIPSLPPVDWSLGAGPVWLAAYVVVVGLSGLALIVHGLTLAPATDGGAQ